MLWWRPLQYGEFLKYHNPAHIVSYHVTRSFPFRILCLPPIKQSNWRTTWCWITVMHTVVLLLIVARKTFIWFIWATQTSWIKFKLKVYAMVTLCSDRPGNYISGHRGHNRMDVTQRMGTAWGTLTVHDCHGCLTRFLKRPIFFADEKLCRPELNSFNTEKRDST